MIWQTSLDGAAIHIFHAAFLQNNCSLLGRNAIIVGFDYVNGFTAGHQGDCSPSSPYFF